MPTIYAVEAGEYDSLRQEGFFTTRPAAEAYKDLLSKMTCWDTNHPAYDHLEIVEVALDEPMNKYKLKALNDFNAGKRAHKVIVSKSIETFVESASPDMIYEYPDTMKMEEKMICKFRLNDGYDSDSFEINALNQEDAIAQANELKETLLNMKKEEKDNE